MKSKFLAILACASAALLPVAPASAAIVVSFVPTASTVAVGGSVSVAMNISGLDTQILSAFDINLLFNSAVLSNTAVTHNVATQWSAASYFGAPTFAAGNTGVSDYTFDSDAMLAGAQAKAFTVLTFAFTGLADGTSNITLGPDVDFDRNFVGLLAHSLDVQVGSICIAVGTGSCVVGNVPEPATLGLLGMGLIGLAGLRRRQAA